MSHVSALSPVHTVYGAVRRRRTQQLLNYVLHTVVVNRNCIAVRCRTATDGTATQHAAQIDVASVAPVAVRRRSACERCRRNHRARLQRRRAVLYSDVRRRT